MEDTGCLVLLIIAFFVGLLGYKAGPCLLENSCGQPAPPTAPASGSAQRSTGFAP